MFGGIPYTGRWATAPPKPNKPPGAPLLDRSTRRLSAKLGTLTPSGEAVLTQSLSLSLSLPFEEAQESRLLASDHNFALLALLAPELPNTVLVQLGASCLGGRRCLSLYSVYREGTLTFDTITRFEIADPALPLADALQRFVDTDDFKASVLAPLVREVRHHFCR
jgi:hypothetical protein